MVRKPTATAVAARLPDETRQACLVKVRFEPGPIGTESECN